jgi:hypothetical protein
VEGAVSYFIMLQHSSEEAEEKHEEILHQDSLIMARIS